MSGYLEGRVLVYRLIRNAQGETLQAGQHSRWIWMSGDVYVAYLATAWTQGKETLLLALYPVRSCARKKNASSAWCGRVGDEWLLIM